LSKPISKLQPHPASWWLLSLGLIALASNSGLPVLLALVLLLASLGLAAPTGSAYAKSVRLYVLLAIAVLVTRLLFRVIFNYQTVESDPLFTVPPVTIPLGWLGQIELFGAVTAASLNSAATEGLRLAAIVLSAGLANTLGSPKKLLRSIPGALQEVGTALAIAFNFAPALVSGFERVRASQLLRGRSRRQNMANRVLIPVLEDAIEQSFHLAATMATRGFGRMTPLSSSRQTWMRLFTLLSLTLVIFSTFLLLATNHAMLAISLLILAVCAGGAAIRTGSPAGQRTTLNPQKIGAIDLIMAAIAASVTALSLMGVLA